MSLLLRSELRLRVGPRRCRAELWRRGLPARAVAAAGFRASSDEDDVVEGALQALAAKGLPLPQRATLRFEDPLLYYALLPAEPGWGGGEEPARRFFAGALGAPDLTVAAVPAPGGRRWLALALDSAHIARASATLAQHGVALHGAGAALLEDLHLVPQRLPRDGVVALVREEGIVLLHCHAHAWTDFTWQRCEGHESGQVERHIEAAEFRYSTAVGVGVAAPPRPAVLMVLDHAAPGSPLARVAAARGWSVCTLPASGAAPAQEAAAP